MFHKSILTLCLYSAIIYFPHIAEAQITNNKLTCDERCNNACEIVLASCKAEMESRVSLPQLQACRDLCEANYKNQPSKNDECYKKCWDDHFEANELICYELAENCFTACEPTPTPTQEPQKTASFPTPMPTPQRTIIYVPIPQIGDYPSSHLTPVPPKFL